MFRQAVKALIASNAGETISACPRPRTNDAGSVSRTRKAEHGDAEHAADLTGRIQQPRCRTRLRAADRGQQRSGDGRDRQRDAAACEQHRQREPPVRWRGKCRPHRQIAGCGDRQAGRRQHARTGFSRQPSGDDVHQHQDAHHRQEREAHRLPTSRSRGCAPPHRRKTDAARPASSAPAAPHRRPGPAATRSARPATARRRNRSTPA